MRTVEFLRRAESTAPVVVLGNDEVALGIVRDLGVKGVPVLVVGPDANGPAFASRYAAARRCTDPHHDEEGFIEDLEAIAPLLPSRAVLFPAHDDFVFAASRYKDRLEGHFDVPVMPWKHMRLVADKEEQLRLAWRAGIDTPATAFIHSGDDLGLAVERVAFPAVMKPLVPMAFVRAKGFKAVRIESSRDLRDTYERLSGFGPVLVQEFVPGDDAELEIAGTYHDARSQCRAIFTGRKLRQHPRNLGVTRLGESRWSAEVAGLTVRLLAEARYRGVSDVEFKFDVRKGRHLLMEINARHGYWTPLARIAGVNLSYVAYQDVIGRPFRSRSQRDGVRWSDLLRDGPDSLKEWRRGDLSLSEWLGPLSGVRVDAYLSLRDPIPGVRETLRLAGRQLRKALARPRPWAATGSQCNRSARPAELPVVRRPKT